MNAQPAHLEEASEIDPNDYNVVSQANPVTGDHTPREFAPEDFGFFEEECPEAAAAMPSILDVATRKNNFLAKLRIAVVTNPQLVSDLIRIQLVCREGICAELEEDLTHLQAARIDTGGTAEVVSILPQLYEISLRSAIKHVLYIDLNEHFGVQKLSDVLSDLRQGYRFTLPDTFAVTPERWLAEDEMHAICEATRYGGWMLHHYLGKAIEVDEKGSAGDFCSDLDLSSDLAAVYSIRASFKGQIATTTILDKQKGLFLAQDDTAEAIRQRGEKPVFIVAEESSPDFDIDLMESGDRVVFIDGMDGSSAAKFQKPDGASVMVGMGIVALDEAEKKQVDLTSSSILFPGSRVQGTEDTWYFAEKGAGAFVRRGQRELERLNVQGESRSLEDAHLKVNRYGDASLETNHVRKAQERCRQRDQGWETPSATTIGLPSSEHGLRVVDPNSGHHISVSDNNPKNPKVGLWDLVTMLMVREAGGVVQTFDGKDVRIPSEPEPLIFARSQTLADGLRAMVSFREDGDEAS